MRGPRPELREILLVFSIVSGCGGESSGLLEQRVAARQNSKPAPSLANSTEIHALARIEPADGVIAVGSRPGARIEKMLVAEGDEVKAGQPLALLEGEAQAKAQLALAEAQKRDAITHRAHKREALAVDRSRIDHVQTVRIEMLANVYRTLAARADDVEKLIKEIDEKEAATPTPPVRPGVPPPTLTPTPLTLSPKDRNDLKVGLSQLRVESYKAYLAQEEAKADQTAIPKQRAVEDKQLADGGAADEALDQQIEIAKANLESLTVRAPYDGRILDISAHAGEVHAGQLPLLSMGNLSSIVANAEVDQSEVSAIAIGDPAEVVSQGKTLTGKVTRIGRIVGKNQMARLDPRAPQDLRVVKVTILLDEPESANRVVNMQVDATIRPQGRQP